MICLIRCMVKDSGSFSSFVDLLLPPVKYVNNYGFKRTTLYLCYYEKDQTMFDLVDKVIILTANLWYYSANYLWAIRSFVFLKEYCLLFYRIKKL